MNSQFHRGGSVTARGSEFNLETVTGGQAKDLGDSPWNLRAWQRRYGPPVHISAGFLDGHGDGRNPPSWEPVSKPQSD